MPAFTIEAQLHTGERLRRRVTAGSYEGALKKTAKTAPVKAFLPIDQCSLSDIARRLDVSRQAVSKWTTGDRGGGGFPLPLDPDAQIYSWLEVTRWEADRETATAEKGVRLRQHLEALARARVNASIFYYE